MKIVSSLNLMVENLIQLIDSNVPYKTCIENIQNLICSEKFKKYYQKFIINYKSYGYNLSLSLKILEDNFLCPELNEFISVLKNFDNDENLVDNLTCLSEVLRLKKEEMLLKKVNAKKFKVGVCIFLLLINCFVIILYPLINDIRMGIYNILK